MFYNKIIMARSARLLLSQSYYHIMTRGNNKTVVFRDDADYDYFLELIAKYKEKHPFDLYHYCLMPNHVHFQVKTKNASDFAVFMKKINLAYFHHYRQKYGWTGHLWQGRYKSQPIGKDAYFIQCGKYIEINPARKKLAQNPRDYFYSSHNYYAFGEPNVLITEDIFYNDLGKTKKERQKAYQKLIIGDIIIKNYKDAVWGDADQQHNEKGKIRYHISKRNSKRK